MTNSSTESFADGLTEDFSDPVFQSAFRRYFEELGLRLRDWEGLFREMNSEGGNAAFLRTGHSGEALGFIMFKPILFTSWFFEETCGFVREFWVAPEVRGRGHGSALLAKAEGHLLASGIHTSILTTDTAADFYLRRGYAPAPGCRAKNHDAVFVKRLG